MKRTSFLSHSPEEPQLKHPRLAMEDASCVTSELQTTGTACNRLTRNPIPSAYRNECRTTTEDGTDKWRRSSGEGSSRKKSESPVSVLQRMFQALDMHSLDMIFHRSARPVYELRAAKKVKRKGNRRGSQLICQVKLSLKTLLTSTIASLVDVPKHLEFSGESNRSIERAKNKAARSAINLLIEIRSKIRKNAQENVKESIEEKLCEWSSGDWRRAREMAFLRAREAILEVLHGSKVVLFGSSGYFMDFPHSDIDVSVTLPSPIGLVAGFNTEYFSAVGVLKFLSQYIEHIGMEQVCVIDTARVPVLKYYDSEHKTNVDVVIRKSSLPNDMTILRSRLIRSFVLSHPRVWEVAMVVKYWAEQRGINSAFNGYVNSMTWVLMAIWFLQVRTPPIAPRVLVKNHRTQYKERDALIVKVSNRSCSELISETPSTLDLLIEFFEFFDSKYEFRTSSVCVRKGRHIPRDVLEKPDPAAPLYVQDPFEPTVNLATKLRGQAYQTFTEEVHRAVRYLRDFGDFERMCSERKEEKRVYINNSIPRPSPNKRRPRSPLRRGSHAN